MTKSMLASGNSLTVRYIWKIFFFFLLTFINIRVFCVSTNQKKNYLRATNCDGRLREYKCLLSMNENRTFIYLYDNISLKLLLLILTIWISRHAS